MTTTRSDASEVIEVVGLTKHYGRIRALDGLDLSVAAGEVHGFLGPNGAGKSTTIRILLGLARPTSGTARVFGDDPWRSARGIHSRIAYVPGDVALWPGLTGGECIDLIARLRGADTRSAEYRTGRDRLTDVFRFDPRRKSREYSKGNRQKVALIAALATPAELYILDEPTSGLDPVMEAVFTAEVHRIAAEGASVLLSSHILSEVEALCSRVSIIRAGRVAESGTLAELRHLTRTEVSFDANAIAERDEAERMLALPAAHDIGLEAGRVAFTVDSDAVTGVLPRLAELRVTGLRVAPPSLEDLFLRHYGDELAGDADDGGGGAGDRAGIERAARSAS